MKDQNGKEMNRDDIRRAAMAFAHSVWSDFKETHSIKNNEEQK